MFERRSWWGKLVSVFVGLLGGLLITEAALRIANVSYPNFYVPDFDRGMAFRPGAEGWSQEESSAYIKINSCALRDREHTKEKLANTFRVAVLGDSYAEALQLPVEETFWSVMERRLNNCNALAGRRAEAINFGVSGYSSAQELITLQKYVWEYSPDVIILAFFSSNDVRDNVRSLRLDDNVPYFIYRQGELVADLSFRNSPSFRLRSSKIGKLFLWLVNESRAAQVANRVRYLCKQRLLESTRQRLKDQRNGSGIFFDDLVYREPTDRAWQRAWEVTELLIARMAREISKRGRRFLVVTLTDSIQVDPKPSARRNFMNRLHVHNLLYPEQRISELGKKEGFPVLTLAPVFREYTERNHVYLHGFGDQMGSGHWNAKGHQLAGEMIAEELCDELQR